MLQMPTRPSRFAHSRAAGLFGALTAVAPRCRLTPRSVRAERVRGRTPTCALARAASARRALRSRRRSGRRRRSPGPRGRTVRGARAPLRAGRSRAVGVRSARSGVFAPGLWLGADDLAEPELVLEEFADGLVPEGSGQLLRRVGVDDLDALVEVVRRDEVAVLQRVHPRVLQMPDGTGLADRSPLETDDPRLLADDLRVSTDLPLRRGALLFAHVGGKRELGDVRHDLR